MVSTVTLRWQVCTAMKLLVLMAFKWNVEVTPECCGGWGGGGASIYHLYYQALILTGGTQIICLPEAGVTISRPVHFASNTTVPPPWSW